MLTLLLDLVNTPAHYHNAELAETLSIMAACTGKLHYREQVDDHVRKMRSTALEMNHVVRHRVTLVLVLELSGTSFLS